MEVQRVQSKSHRAMTSSLSSLSLSEENEEKMSLGSESSGSPCFTLLSASSSRQYRQFLSQNSFVLDSSSSSSSASSPLASSPLLSPWSPAVSEARASVPFSWEAKPGVPKKRPTKLDCFAKLIPPPNANGNTTNYAAHFLNNDPFVAARRHRSAKKCSPAKEEVDPFVAALRECTKQKERDKNKKCNTDREKPRYSISCMRSCAVSDAHVALPRMPNKYAKNRSLRTTKELSRTSPPLLCGRDSSFSSHSWILPVYSEN